MAKTGRYIKNYFAAVFIGIPFSLFAQDTLEVQSVLEKRMLSDSLILNTLRDTLPKSEMEKELLQLLQKAVEEGVIENSFRDSVLSFLYQNKIVIKDGVRIQPLPFFQELEKTDPRPSLFSGVKNGINTSILLPDKLPVPERDSKNRYVYENEEQRKQKMLQIGYFSKGIDGYYQKMIAIGMVGAGWENTRATWEVVERTKNSIAQHLAAWDGMPQTPGFIKKLATSRSGFKRTLGSILLLLHNGSMSGAARSYPGYQNSNYLIRTPPAPPQSR